MTRTRRALALAVAAVSGAAALAAGGVAYADHCPPTLPPAVWRVCNGFGDVTEMECWYYPETGEIVCWIPD